MPGPGGTGTRPVCRAAGPGRGGGRTCARLRQALCRHRTAASDATPTSAPSACAASSTSASPWASATCRYARTGAGRPNGVGGDDSRGARADRARDRLGARCGATRRDVDRDRRPPGASKALDQRGVVVGRDDDLRPARHVERGQRAHEPDPRRRLRDGVRPLEAPLQRALEPLDLVGRGPRHPRRLGGAQSASRSGRHRTVSA